MIPVSAPAKILMAIPLDPDDSKELLSWAISVLARPNDDIVAIHIIVGEETKKQRELIKRKRSQIRQAKAHVISVLGEFARTCQSQQINLEARVGFSSSISKGLIQEAKSISADYLLIRGLRSRSNRTWHEVIRYCFKHAPEGCTVISIGKCVQRLQNSDSKETESSSRWLCNRSGRATTSPVVSKVTSQKSSPRSVIDELDGESHSTEDDTISFEGSSITTESPSLPSKFKSESKIRKQMSACKIISSIFTSPLRKRRGSFSNKEKQQPLLKCFTYGEIANATNNFHTENIVGRGGYSEVYRGDLSDGRRIAVKRLAEDNKDATKEKEFLIELGKTSLSLEWAVRFKIVLGVARGLHYLHKCCKHRIIHRDIKASNVLLGPDYEPQITDFGLAKWLPNKWTHHAVIPIEGTFGYLAPEYFMHGIVDEKTDVFAFGVLLLEIISGRRPVDSSKQNLLLWAKPLMESGKISELADPKLEGKFDEDQMYRVVLTASYCVRQSSVWRPSMSEVLELLTIGHDSELARSWRMPKFTSDELDDYSMVFGYEVPVDVALEDYL
ncbi:probable receptor-like serine/threonine-protein kinase At5g57670 isoform X2 [Hevea brasiliensis]|uniref:probable receptor-like serine/threonine-protein kinase At5g57670 isoform X2 n=1 Tax=Hevea brasiliensis TaxID=3981 RepID=UPI0025E3F722|nr:probable receptor-like serine/threonine-protein kinase At5g57670 isoform X2 [Hevea brasiliensis]